MLAIETHHLQLATSNALRGVLESPTGSIESLELIGINTCATASSRPVVEGLISAASSVTDIIFNSCSCFSPQQWSDQALDDILTRKPNLRALTFKFCRLASPRLPPFPPALVSAALRRADSPLLRFHFEKKYYHETDASNQSFHDLCSAVADSKLESFSVGVITSLRLFQTLAETIPSMKVQKLVILFEIGEGEWETIKQELLRIVKTQFTLQSLNYRRGGYLFDAADEDQTMKFYLERNTRLAQWVEDPSTVEKHLWKQAVTQAARAGPETLYRILRKVGPAVLPQSRKRKRSG